MVNAVTSFAGGATNQGRALALVYFALVGLGLFGAARGSFHVDLDLRTRPRGRALALVLTGTLAVAVVGGYASRSAFQARYASVVFVPLVLLVALGLVTFADGRIRAGVLTATVAFGLASGLPSAWTSRTQAGQVASTLAQLGRPGDVVAYCPDQIGPSVNRLLPPGRYREITFPRGTGPQFVNWVDYATASARGHPASFATRLEQLSAARPPDLAGLGARVPDLRDEVRGARGRPARRHLARGARDVPVPAGDRLLDHLREHGVGPLRPRRLTDVDPALAAPPASVAIEARQALRLRALRADTRAQEAVSSQRAWSVEVSVVLARLRRLSNMPATMPTDRGDRGCLRVRSRACALVDSPRRP